MGLVSQVDDLATRIANYLRDTVLPRVLPAGGTAGQVLSKINSTDFNTQWTTPAGGSALVTISDAAPSSSSAGALWWQSSTGLMFIYYSDGNTRQWVDILPKGLADAPSDGNKYVRKDGAWVLA